LSQSIFGETEKSIKVNTHIKGETGGERSAGHKPNSLHDLYSDKSALSNAIQGKKAEN